MYTRGAGSGGGDLGAVRGAPEPAAGRGDRLHDLPGRPTRRHHVLHHQAALATGDREAPPEAHGAVFALGEERARSEGARDLVGDEDAPDRGGDDDLHALLLEGRGQLGAERRRVLRALQHERGLQIGVGVEP